MILITGATGQYGRLTIEFLLQKGVPASNIRALVRDEAKAQDLVAKGIGLAIGDYDHYLTLVAALIGIDQLLLISGSDVEKRVQQHEAVISAAKECGVKHIVYTSFQRVNESDTSPIAFIAKSHLHTEQLILSSGMTSTILRNSLYADVIPMFIGNRVAETGVFFPAGEGRGAFALRSDMAEATATILAGAGHENKVYLFSNTETVSFAEITAVLSQIFGKSLPYVSPDVETFSQVLGQAGVPAPIIGMSVGFGEAIRQGEFAETSNDLERLLGRKPATVADYLKSFMKNFTC